MNIQVGAGVIIIRNRQILLTKRKGSHAAGRYGSLGGHVEFGESPMQAVVREAQEELGIQINNISFISCINLVKYNKHYLDVTFSANIESGEPSIQEPDKIELVGWYDLDNLPSPLFEPVEYALKAMQTKQSYFEINC